MIYHGLFFTRMTSSVGLKSTRASKNNCLVLSRNVIFYTMHPELQLLLIFQTGTIRGSEKLHCIVCANTTEYLLVRSNNLLHCFFISFPFRLFPSARKKKSKKFYHLFFLPRRNFQREKSSTRKKGK